MHLNNIIILLCTTAIMGASVKRSKANKEDSLEELQAISNDSKDLRIEERTIRYEELLPLDPIEYDEVVETNVAITRIARHIYDVMSSKSFAGYNWVQFLKGVVSIVFDLYGDLLMPLLSSTAVLIIRSLT